MISTHTFFFELGWGDVTSSLSDPDVSEKSEAYKALCNERPSLFMMRMLRLSGNSARRLEARTNDLPESGEGRE